MVLKEIEEILKNMRGSNQEKRAVSHSLPNYSLPMCLCVCVSAFIFHTLAYVGVCARVRIAVSSAFIERK